MSSKILGYVAWQTDPQSDVVYMPYRSEKERKDIIKVGKKLGYIIVRES